MIAILMGTVIGGLAGYYTKLDGPLMRLTDMFLALPLLPLLLVIIMLFRDTLRAAFGPEMGIFMLIVFVIGILNWMPTARVVRAQVLAVKEQEFVVAAVALGTPEFRILVRHVLPNLSSSVTVLATMDLGWAILSSATLSFLGLGAQPPMPEWGAMINEGRGYLRVAPWISLAPGAMVALSVLASNLLGDGLRDALDPRFGYRV